MEIRLEKVWSTRIYDASLHKLEKKTNTDHLPLYQKIYSVYKVVNKLKFKEMIVKYGR